ncbi:hypothetical protein [Mesorhizobium sp. ZC-5]|nr:hypothetical protein [Mesorhizobium sp. ZC-5]MCV3241757.1 hypothetical protein [Mesorhizobium sp. ZC-5]
MYELIGGTEAYLGMQPLHFLVSTGAGMFILALFVASRAWR